LLLSSILPFVASMHPTNYAMKYKSKTIKYSDLLAQVNRVAYGLHSLSIKPGQRIALLGNPSPYLAIAECAAVAIGAIPVAIFPHLAATEINQILQDADPAAVVYDDDLLNMADIPFSLHIQHLIPCMQDHAANSIESFMLTCPSLNKWHKADEDDIAIIIYTGGTTGRSKGVMHSHRTISSWSFMSPAKGGGHHPTKKSLVPNQAHLTGQFILWTTLYEGGCLIYPDHYPLRAEEVVDIIEREQIKFLGTVGLLFRDIVNLEDIKNRQLQSVEGISCGGAPISEQTFYKALDIFPNAQIKEVYSQTESGQFISFLSINQCMIEGTLNRLVSVGKPSDMAAWGQKPYQVRIVDECGNDVPQGAIGEIICKGDQMMLGYWRNPNETKKAIQDGWLYTGDLGRFDEDGYLYLLDRRKDIVIVNGLNVYCSEVEEVLSKHPSIVEVAVIGTPLPEEGEEVTAIVITMPNSTITLTELKEYCHAQLAPFKIPTRLEMTSSLARTSVGKLNKAELRKHYWSGKARFIN